MATLTFEALSRLGPRERWHDRARRAAGVLKSFQIKMSTDGTLSAGFDVEAVQGHGDSGNLERDLVELFLALGEAAQEQERGVAFLLDEAQFLNKEEFEALIAGIHKTVQRQVPITLVGAGLPHLPRLAAEAKSYAERLFTFPSLGRLNPKQAARALLEPAEKLGVDYQSDAIEAIIDYTEGYPYFIQEYGKLIWDIAPASPITTRDVYVAREAVEAKLDSNFFRVRAERTTDAELQYLRAMSELPPTPQQAKTVAKVLGKNSEQLAATRSRLIEKGLLYSPAHGLAAFTVPQFDRFMRRTQALESIPDPEGR